MIFFKAFQLYKYYSQSRHGFEYVFPLKIKNNHRGDYCWEYARIEPYQTLIIIEEDHCLLDLEQNVGNMVEVILPIREHLEQFFSSLFSEARIV